MDRRQRKKPLQLIAKFMTRAPIRAMMHTVTIVSIDQAMVMGTVMAIDMDTATVTDMGMVMDMEIQSINVCFEF